MVRYNGQVKPFGDNATTNYRFTFGNLTESDDINDNLNANYLAGWEVLDPNVKPPIQWFNGSMYTISYLVSYLYEKGVAEYNSLQPYTKGSIVNYNNNLYQAIIDTTGNLPTNTSKWKILGGNPHSATEKTSIVDSDEIGLSDSANSFSFKKITWASIKSAIRAAISSSDVTDTNTYTNFTPTKRTQIGVNKGIDNALTKQIMIVEDQKPYNVAGGTSVVGIQTRTLNTIVYNNIIGARLSSNRVTLPAGRYKISASAPSGAARTTTARILLKNVNKSTYIAYGTREIGVSSSSVTSNIDTVVSFSTTTTIQLDHEIRMALSNYGLGGYGTLANTSPSVYARMVIEKIGA